MYDKKNLSDSEGREIPSVSNTIMKNNKVERLTLNQFFELHERDMHHNRNTRKTLNRKEGTVKETHKYNQIIFAKEGNTI